MIIRVGRDARLKDRRRADRSKGEIKSNGRVKDKVKVKGDGQECPSHMGAVLGLEFGGFGEAELALGQGGGEDFFYFVLFDIAGHGEFADDKIAGAL